MEPLALALGEERLVGSDRTISFNSVRYSTPPDYTGAKVWCRMVGEELSITARTNSGYLSAIWRHRGRTACAVRIRAKMARAVELAAVLGSDRVDQALGLAATAGRFADGDLLSILGHLADSKPAGEVVRADETHSTRNGTIGWQALSQ
ncbi:Mu transposase domain-containing protein [Streptomyces lydicus]